MLTNACMRALALAMAARGVKRPLLQFVRFADLWVDLCALTGADVPKDVAEAAKQPPFAGYEESRP